MSKLFIETLSLFSDNIEDDKLSNERWGEYSFDINEVIGYNKSELGYTTIQIINSERWIIAIKYEEFVKIMKKEFNHIRVIDPEAEYKFKEGLIIKR